MIPNDFHLSASFRNAHRMILHAGAAADIPEDQDLDGRLWCRPILSGRSGLRVILGRKEEDQDRERRGDVEGDADEGFDHGGGDWRGSATFSSETKVSSHSRCYGCSGVVVVVVVAANPTIDTVTCHYIALLVLLQP